MQRFEEDKLSMEIGTNDLLSKTPAEILDKMPGISNLRAKFNDNVTKLGVFQYGQTLNRTGNRVNKDELRQLMTKKTFEIAATLSSIAYETNNDVLESQVDYPISTLEKMRDTTIANTADGILLLAQDFLTELLVYEVTAITLQELEDSILLYRAVLPSPRAGIVTKTTYTKRIKQLFKENAHILVGIDKLVTRLVYKEPDFHNLYFQTRKIVKTGNHTLSIRGLITNQMGQPINKVKITVETPKEVTTISTAKGYFQFKGIQSGVFPVTFERDGYLKERAFLVFTPTLRVDHNVVLQSNVEQKTVVEQKISVQQKKQVSA